MSERSSCSILQGTKVGSAKEHDQVHIRSPEIGSAKQYSLLQAELINLKEIEYPPVDLNTPPAAYILNKHPRQSRPKDCSPAVHQTFKGITSSPAYQNFPKRVQSNPVPQERWNSYPQAISLSPVDSGSLSPRRARTRRPALFKELFP